MRKTKIICTMGPALDQDDLLKSMLTNGMNVARFNFSHGSHQEHLGRVQRVRRLSEALDQPVALLLDTRGPEIRTGHFEEGSVRLETGDLLVLSATEALGSRQLIPVSYEMIHEDVRPGSQILIDDGLIELSVQEIIGREVHCRVMNGGVVSDRKSVNLPNISTRLPSITDKDIADIAFAAEHDFDFIAASFVRKAADVLEIRKTLNRHHGENIHLIAKIENREGVNNFDEILKVADGIMVARGDLGVEIPIQEVPMIQKNIIEKCYKIGKPCITATQMLDSMIRNPRPTRAEVSDVANAIIDGTSAVMLSGETSVGHYPLETLQMMDRIARQIEQSIDYWQRFQNSRYEMAPSVANAISHATCTTAMDLNAAAIVAVTHSGRTARLISRFRPKCPVIATTVSRRSQRQLCLSWGIFPYLVDEVGSTDAMFELGISKARESGAARDGDVIVITGGTPIGMSGTTNTLKVETVGCILASGISIGKGVLSGEVLLVRDMDELQAAVSRKDYVLVTRSTNHAMLQLVRQAKAMIVEDEDPSGHAVTVAMALDIPLIYACENATRMLSGGSIVTIDFDRGTIS